MLKNILENNNRRDYIIKKNIRNLKKMPSIINLQIKSVFFTENLSEKELNSIINIIELIEGLSKQKIMIFGDHNNNENKEKYNITKKKINVKTILSNFLLDEFFKYFFYIFVPTYKYRNNIFKVFKQKQFVNNKNLYYYDIKIDYNNLFYGFSKELNGYLMIRFSLKNVESSLIKEFLSLYSIYIKK